MATHGRSGPGRWLYGSVADEVLRRSPVPVVLVPADAGPVWAGDRALTILVPLDGSALAEAALGPAQTWANGLGAEVVLLRVVPWPPVVFGGAVPVLVADPQAELDAAQAYLGGVAARLPGTVHCRAELGRSTSAIIAQVAGQERADLIAMATHGRGGLARLVLGSVATGVVQRAGAPLLLVRPGKLQTPSAAGAAEPRVEPVSARPTVAVPLSQPDLDLLQRGLGELLYRPAGDLELAAIRDLRARLDQVQVAPTGPAVTGTRS